MGAKSIGCKTDRRYFIQYYRKPDWIFSNLDKLQGGILSPDEAAAIIDEVMQHHNDFVSSHYRLVERTTIIIDEPLDRFGKGW